MTGDWFDAGTAWHVNFGGTLGVICELASF